MNVAPWDRGCLCYRQVMLLLSVLLLACGPELDGPPSVSADALGVSIDTRDLAIAHLAAGDLVGDCWSLVNELGPVQL